MSQKELLYEIVCLHSQRFFLAMEDRWGDREYELDDIWRLELMKLEKQYKLKYGDLPDWGNSIEKIWEIKAELKEELGR